MAGKKRALGIDDGNTPVGAFVTYTGKNPDNGSGEPLVIKKMYLSLSPDEWLLEGVLDMI